MIEIEVQKAYQGDCIWIRCLGKENVNIVIDAGPSTFAKGFKELANRIKISGERINLLIFSHIDDDHIKGCIRYFQDKGEKIVDRVWINGYGTTVYSKMQEHSVNNVSSVVDLIESNGISVDAPVYEGKEYKLKDVFIKAIGPTEKDIVVVADKIDKITEHSGSSFVGSIDEVVDEYKPDVSPTNKASILIIIEFENKKLLFTGDSTAENIVKALDKFCVSDKFEVVKLPHHGSPRNISRELINRLNTNKFMISTNKKVDKVTLRRLVEEKEHVELLINYSWWKQEYFTTEDKEKYIDTGRIIMKDIGDKKESL